MAEPKPIVSSEERSRRLPAPFDDVYFEWDASESGIRLLYAGSPSRLIECGAIEPDMAEKAKVKTRPRRDSAGHYYHRDRWIDTKALTANVTIVRYVTDEAFAKTLPGAPRGLRFKMLDWLDAHPDRVYLTQEKSEDGETRISTTGTIDNLLAAGFRQSLFKQRFSIRGIGLDVTYCGDVREKHVDPSRIDLYFGRICPLMRGYFEIATYLEKNETRATGAPTTAEASAKKRPALRLVVDNDSI